MLKPYCILTSPSSSLFGLMIPHPGGIWQDFIFMSRDGIFPPKLSESPKRCYLALPSSISASDSPQTVMPFSSSSSAVTPRPAVRAAEKVPS